MQEAIQATPGFEDERLATKIHIKFEGLHLE